MRSAILVLYVCTSVVDDSPVSVLVNVATKPKFE